MTVNNHAHNYIRSTHEVDFELATACLQSPSSELLDKQEAIKEQLVQIILLRAFDAEHIPASYKAVNDSRSKMRLATNAKQLLASDEYIADIVEWYQVANRISARFMPAIATIAYSARREVRAIIQALFESLPLKNPMHVRHDVATEFITSDLDEFDLEVVLDHVLHADRKYKGIHMK